LTEVIKKYKISTENIYNIDEKGFLLGLLNKIKQIVPLDMLQSKQLIGPAQDGSREFITLIAAICADGTFLPPGLIYQEESSDLRDTWLKDFDPAKDCAWFSISQNGWSSDGHALEWLEKVFNRHIKRKAGRGYRLLVLDGHHSHVNLEFVDFAD